MVPACILSLTALHDGVIYLGYVSHINSVLPRSYLVSVLLQKQKVKRPENEEYLFFMRRIQCYSEVYHCFYSHLYFYKHMAQKKKVRAPYF